MINPETMPAAVRANFEEVLLSTPTRNLIYSLMADHRKKPANTGDTVRFMRFNRMPTALAPLAGDGSTPPPSDLTAVYIDAKMSFYGSWLPVPEQVQLQHQCPILNQTAIRLGVQMYETEDELTMLMLSATANVINATSGVSADLPTEINPTDLLEATTGLQSADAMTIAESIEASEKFGTGPTYSAFWCLTHTDMIPNLTAMPNFIPKYNYSRQENVLNSEIGAFAYARFLVSSAGSITRAGSVLGADVYNSIIVGSESYGIIDQESYGPSFIHRPPMYSGPLARVSTVGWKTAMVPRIYNDQWVCLLRSVLV